MKNYHYKVWFANENYKPQAVRVSNQQTALILAQGERIRAGLDYTLHEIEKTD